MEIKGVSTSALATTTCAGKKNEVYKGKISTGATTIEVIELNIGRSPSRRRPASHIASAKAKLTARKYTHLEKAKRCKTTEKFQQRFSNNKRVI